jgi:DNA-binding LytR/AlgR family response regulator
MDMGGGAVFLRVWSYCTVISISIMVLFVLLRGSNEAEIAPSPFFQRLPKHLGKKLLHLSAQDHYVEAVTENGSHLILMRFSDALKELANTDGIQIHRAHWVSMHAIKKPVRKENKFLIETTDGKRFPVSRSYSKQVKAVLNI